LENQIFASLSSCIFGLRDIGVPPPLILMFTLTGVKGASYEVRHDIFGDGSPPFSEDDLTLPECVLEDYGTEIDHHRAVRPAFDALWNAIGRPQAAFFNADGRWVDPQAITRS
jgi:hypothetical protein